MTRSAVGMALGLGLLIVPSLAHAQTPDLTERHWRGPFSNVTFGATPAAPNPRPRLQMFNSRLPVSPTPLKRQDLPDLPIVPPPCVMPVVPPDPSIDRRMPVGKVDERLDPRFVVKIPGCRPAK